jgi:pimeloyl-ACP methyl ester carboxylesterase
MIQKMILLRGLARETGHWGPFRDFLLEHYPESQFEFLDTAGNGTELLRTSFFDIKDYTEDLRKRSSFIANSFKPIVVGVSMGGMIAADWALRYPKELSGIVLINSSFGNISDPWDRLRPEVFLRIVKIAKANLHSQAFESELETLRMISNQKFSFKKRWAEEFHTLPSPSLLNVTRQLIACSRYLGSRRPPEVPSLILASLHDRMVSYRCSESIQGFWKTHFHLHPWAGHDLPFDDAAWTLDHIRTFAKSLENSTTEYQQSV